MKVSENLKKFFPFEYFNNVQTKCFPHLLHSNSNSIISAPTGSGKTILLELAIIKNLFSNCEGKFLYLSPMKSLCHEKYKEWNNKFGIQTLELTGDYKKEAKEIFSSKLIISTPEKWEATLYRCGKSLETQVSIILVDEIQLINSENRGYSIEKILSKATYSNIYCDCLSCNNKNARIIAISATIPNIEELGYWLKVPKSSIFEFDISFRPVQIEKIVIGYHGSKNNYLFESKLNYKVLEIIRKYSSNKPTLIFCQTQKGSSECCQKILEDSYCNEFVKSNDSNYLVQNSLKLEDKYLANFFIRGIAYHNAKLTLADREIIESAFLLSKLKVLCTTSTLAMGVNLPARLVIIKSTVGYKGAGNGYCEYSTLEIEQMMGRAGRPQFDDKGVCVIMTETEKVVKYTNLSKGDPLQSNLKEKFEEFINSQIVLEDNLSFERILEITKNTFYFRQKEFSTKMCLAKKKVENDFENFIEYSLKNLKINGIIEEINNNLYKATNIGELLCKYYISMETLSNLKSALKKSINQDIPAIISYLSESEEFSHITSKLTERKELKSINSQIIFPLKGSISTYGKKVNVLIQAILSGINVENWEMKLSYMEIKNSSWRILKLFFNFFLEKKMFPGAFNCLLLGKMIEIGSWNSQFQKLLCQIKGIGDHYANILMSSNIKSFQDLIENSNLKNILNMPANKIQNIKDSIFCIPKFTEVNIENQHDSWEINVKISDNMDLIEGVHLLISDKDYFIIGYKVYFQSPIKYKISLDSKFPLYMAVINTKFIGFDRFLTLNSNGYMIDQSLIIFSNSGLNEKPASSNQNFITSYLIPNSNKKNELKKDEYPNKINESIEDFNDETLDTVVNNFLISNNQNKNEDNFDITSEDLVEIEELEDKPLKTPIGRVINQFKISMVKEKNENEKILEQFLEACSEILSD